MKEFLTTLLAVVFVLVLGVSLQPMDITPIFVLTQQI